MYILHVKMGAKDLNDTGKCTQPAITRWPVQGT